MQLLANLGIRASVKKDGFFIEPGLIVEYFGASNTIPEGWALCDGTNGTPDLRNRFIVAAGIKYNIGATGGSANAVIVSHNHGASTGAGGSGSHSHSVRYGPSVNNSFVAFQGRYANHRLPSDENISFATDGSHTHTGSYSMSTAGGSGVNRNLPPYYGLFHIMKMEE